MLRERCRADRHKRLRADGNEQYREIAGEHAHYLDDSYTERFERTPLTDEVDVVVVVGGAPEFVRMLEAWREECSPAGLELGRSEGRSS